MLNLVRSLAATTLVAIGTCANAASLQVAPVLLEIRTPGAASTVTLRNEGPRPISAQARVFRWTQVDGQDVLKPTDAVVASPPMVTLASRIDYAVRVVRTSRQPVVAEEAYRLVLDELPDRSREKDGTVALVLRHSIPVFLVPEDADPPKLSWSTQVQGGRLAVQVTNEGGRRVRLSRMRVGNPGGPAASFGDGLVGYALAGSTMSWSRPAPRGFTGRSAMISVQGDTGPINASASVASGR